MEEQKVHFNIPPFHPKAFGYMEDAVARQKICGDGFYTGKCTEWMKARTKAAGALLTTSCTHALELAALLSGIGPGDEVIMPSYTFVSTADAFVLRGAEAVFVDIRKDTMNLDETLIEDAVTSRTKAIAVVHYAGVSCEMDKICQIAEKYRLKIIEDAAQAMMCAYHGRPLGTIGDYGCYSFHETKNYSMGEGGAILLKHQEEILAAEIIREKGTNRSQFFRGEIDKYSWKEAGSSYLPSDLNAAYLWAQLEEADAVNQRRMENWNLYYELLQDLKEAGTVELPVVPEGCVHNGHMFYIKARDLKERTALLKHLKEKGISAVFHYVPLHSSEAGRKYGRFHGQDKHTTKESDRLLRLPMYDGLKEEQIRYVVSEIKNFYR
ncbi:MAG: dTDP-4-amino-4,6-dideoxygalactose transaminase [Lachnospiraceae bacterium]|nr:dTDP-4-amino-4,6-dideoxygalactose transaminase [Lachnospiraceae bacterium]